MSELMQIMDTELELQITDIFNRWNTESELTIFTASTQPTPEAEIGDLVEPVHAEFARIDLTDLWQGPLRDEAGIWSIQTQFYEFLPPTSGDPVVIWGHAVLVGGEPVATVLYESSVSLTVGGPAYKFRAYYSQFSGLIHAERVCT